MQQIQTHLSIFHDGQFFVALFERWNDDGYSVYRKVLGAEPSSPEIWDMVKKETPAYGQPLASGPPDVTEGNPKRKQREAARISKMPAALTKAQQALQASREAYKKIACMDTAKIRKQREDARYQMRVEKKKQKHRGH